MNKEAGETRGGATNTALRKTAKNKHFSASDQNPKQHVVKNKRRNRVRHKKHYLHICPSKYAGLDCSTNFYKPHMQVWLQLAKGDVGVTVGGDAARELG